MGKKTVKKSKVKELFDLEIDEVSAVDKPAIGEEFYVTKSMNNNKGDAVKKPIKKSVTWKNLVAKGVSEDNTHCVFCGITKEEEAEQLGMGLIKGVCFECACDHAEKGVFDSCIAGTFDAESFQKENPEIELKLSLQKDDDSDEEESEEDEGEEESEEGKKPKAGEEDSDDEEDEEEESEEDEESEKASSNNPVNEDDQGNNGLESDSVDLGKRVVKLEKNLEEVTTMLERSLELHDVAAAALNEVVALNFGALDGVLMMLEEQATETEQSELFTEIVESIKSERESISKKGAKISASRMTVLREISEKLAQLISSVMGETEGAKKKSLNDVQKSLEEMKEELEESSSSFKKDIEEKLKNLESKLDEIEQSGGASFDLGDEEEDDEEDDAPAEKQKSIFSDLIGLDDITKNIERKKRNFRKD